MGSPSTQGRSSPTEPTRSRIKGSFMLGKRVRGRTASLPGLLGIITICIPLSGLVAVRSSGLQILLSGLVFPVRGVLVSQGHVSRSWCSPQAPEGSTDWRIAVWIGHWDLAVAHTQPGHTALAHDKKGYPSPFPRSPRTHTGTRKDGM